MIAEIEIQGFKSLRDVKLRLGDFNLFVGANASGKSNVLDALRVLQGIGYGFTIDEIFNGKPRSANGETWEAIRGGSARSAFAGAGPSTDSAQPAIRFGVTLAPARGRKIRYAIAISPESGCVREENLFVGRGAFSSAYDEIFDSTPFDNPPTSPVIQVRYYRGTRGVQPSRQFEKARPVLCQMPQVDDAFPHYREAVSSCLRALSNTQRLDPSPAKLREYSQARQVKRMGERGENFAALVKTILEDEQTKSAYLTWLRQLTPTELDNVRVLSGALGESLFAIEEHGVVCPAPILSDGTLRFAAIAAAFFQPDMPSLLTVEEIENAIHPTRLRLLVELLRSQASRDRQVVATTHSPIALAWLTEDDYATTFFCRRDEETGASVIAPLSEVPRFLEMVRRHPIGELFAEGWLEGAR